MPHQCVKCAKVYENTATEILTGCNCGSHYFFFFDKKDLAVQEKVEELTQEERQEIVEDVKEIVGEEMEKPVILEFESINVKKPGKFEIDLTKLFKRSPVIYKLEEGKYIIDVASTFQLMKGKG